MDLSRPNKFVIPACYPLPMLPEVYQKVQGTAFLSTLDLMKAYHHTELHPESRPLTLTMTALGPRQYVKMPLGNERFQGSLSVMHLGDFGGMPGVNPIH